MSAVIVRLRIFIEHDRFGGDRFVAAFPRDKVGDLIARLLVEAGIEDDPGKWELFDGAESFPDELTVRQLVTAETPLTSWTLRLRPIQPSLPPRQTAPKAHSPAPPAPTSPSFARLEFRDILLQKNIISRDQLADAEQYATSHGLKLQDAVIRLSYAGAKDVWSAIAESAGVGLIDLTDLEIPKAIIELVPESVARENMVLPLSLEGNTLRIITADPHNYDTQQKLQFILNKEIVPVLAVPEQILDAINRHYGQTETESVDSMLVEFTDTELEFTQIEQRPSAPGGASPGSVAPASEAEEENDEFEDEDFDDDEFDDEGDFDEEGDFDDDEISEAQRRMESAPDSLGEIGPADAPPPAPVQAAPPASPAPQPLPTGLPPAPVSAPPPAARSAVPSPARLPSRSATRSARREEVDEEEEPRDYRRQRSGTVASPAKRKSMTERRATVRYYSRMNPDRVFPLLVMLTRHEVEEIVKRHVEQKATGPIAIAKDVPLEIEPVLPGCVCHPPKVVTRLGASDDVFTFHIVPHVQGEVTGARVLIRQDHAVLAEIKLDMRVVQRTLVVASGLSTFMLPAASAAMKHFGLDFTPKDGSNAYLAALNFLFGEVSPVLLTAALAAITFALYWFTRPKGRDVFWDISTKPPRTEPEK